MLEREEKKNGREKEEGPNEMGREIEKKANWTKFKIRRWHLVLVKWERKKIGKV